LISTPLTKAENPWPTFLVIFNPATLTSLIDNDPLGGTRGGHEAKENGALRLPSLILSFIQETEELAGDAR
jgi:hypothetical protein